VPFDAASERFVDETHAAFLPLNLSSLAPTLVESDLFGYAKGSFTGATHDRAGFLESCPPRGTVFLDEIGELSLEIQVKLLRTLQVREVRRIGEQKNRVFSGKLVTATNRDLSEAVRAGIFREDFYYRLVADQIQTPSLAEQLDDCPEDLARLVEALCARFVPEQEVAEVSTRALGYFDRELGGYRFPGNVRELEQAILSFIVHGRYTPGGAVNADRATLLGQRLLSGHYSFDDLSDLYVTLAYQRYESYAETARQLELDRRTVKSKVRPELLDK
jgi:transcriptional regulator with GAF, ATPase, and Fis domain